MDFDRLRELAEQTVSHALGQGASEAAVGISRARFVTLKRREGKTETLQASTSRGLSLALYVDGRFSSNSTSRLEEGALGRFVDQAVIAVNLAPVKNVSLFGSLIVPVIPRSSSIALGDVEQYRKDERHPTALVFGPAQ